MKKNIAIEAAQAMPEEFHLDVLVERLIFLQRLEEAQQSLDEGKGIPHDEATKQIRQHIKTRRGGRNNLVA